MAEDSIDNHTFIWGTSWSSTELPGWVLSGLYDGNLLHFASKVLGRTQQKMSLVMELTGSSVRPVREAHIRTVTEGRW